LGFGEEGKALCTYSVIWQPKFPGEYARVDHITVLSGCWQLVFAQINLLKF